MKRVAVVLLCIAVVLCLGCEKKSRMKIRAANVTVRGIDGVAVEDLTLTIDPKTVRARRGDQITWTVTAVNNLADEVVVVRAEVIYPGTDGTTVTRSTQADLTVDGMIMGLTFHLYIPRKTGYVWDSLAVDGIAAGNPVHAHELTRELFLLIALAELAAGATTIITYTTEVGATTALPSGAPADPPPARPNL